MADVIKTHKGLNINLKGKAKAESTDASHSSLYAIKPSSFIGLKPRMVVKEGDKVLAGDFLFEDKNCPAVSVASPVSGTVKEVLRGERRKILAVTIIPDEEQQYKDFGKKDVTALSADDVVKCLLETGLFSFIVKRPYAVVADPAQRPKSIFVSAFRDMPLAADFEYELQGNEKDFQTGLTALSHVAKTYLGVSAKQTSKALTKATDVTVKTFSGPCPAGNVGVQINHIEPINKGDVVWTVDPMAVVFFGRMFNTGKVDLRRIVAVAGSRINNPHYVKTIYGTPLKDIIGDNLVTTNDVRIIDGNPLTGSPASADDSLGAFSSEVTAIPEGAERNEMLGWILPRLNQFSVSRSYFTWLQKNKEYDLDSRIKGGERHMIMSGEYDKVLPMDILGEYLIKAIIAGDIERQEQLGIYEVAPEDFALAEFVDSSKLELQKIVREGLDTLRKENS